MSFKNMAKDMDAALFNEFSEVGIYQKKYRASVVIDKDVEQFGAFDTRGNARRHEVSFLVSEIPKPKRGHILETEEGSFVFDSLISNDGNIARWHLNES